MHVIQIASMSAAPRFDRFADDDRNLPVRSRLEAEPVADIR